MIAKPQLPYALSLYKKRRILRLMALLKTRKEVCYGRQTKKSLIVRAWGDC